jgi:hypothetical protein
VNELAERSFRQPHGHRDACPRKTVQGDRHQRLSLALGKLSQLGDRGQRQRPPLDNLLERLDRDHDII